MADTIKTVGSSGRNYSSYTLWEAAQTNCSGGRQIAEGYADSTFAEDVTIQGGTSLSSSNYRYMTAAIGQEWRPDLGTGVHVNGPAGGLLRTIALVENYCRVSDMRVTKARTSGVSDGIAVYGNVAGTRVYRCHIVCGGDTSTHRRYVLFDDACTSTNNNAIWNCVISPDSGVANSDRGHGMTYTGAPTNNRVDNNSVYDLLGTGIHSTNVTMTNNVSIGNGTDFSVGGSGTKSYNASGDSSAPGTNAQTSQVATSYWVDPANEDFHLKAGSNGIDTGTSVGAFSDDFEKTARPVGASWDRGAYERAESATQVSATLPMSLTVSADATFPAPASATLPMSLTVQADAGVIAGVSATLPMSITVSGDAIIVGVLQASATLPMSLTVSGDALGPILASATLPMSLTVSADAWFLAAVSATLPMSLVVTGNATFAIIPVSATLPMSLTVQADTMLYVPAAATLPMSLTVSADPMIVTILHIPHRGTVASLVSSVETTKWRLK